jgi:Rieske Fe-S protein
MSADDDKYPESSDRRRFVKGVVGSASLAAVGTTTAVSVDSATQRTGEGGGTTSFFGIENTDGPAPRAMPMIPIEIDDEGYIKGNYPEISTETIKGEEVQVAEEQLGGITYAAEWFQFCGVQGYAGIQPSYDGDNYFRYSESPPYDWQSDLAGERANIDEFSDYKTWGNDIGKAGLGKPAMVTWRSQDTESTIPAQILRATEVERLQDILTGPAGTWLDAAAEKGAIAWMDKCTHFCCVPTFKGTPQSAQFGGANAVYCPCHQSIYDPYSIVKRAFVAYPRPEDGGGGGGGGGGGDGGGGGGGGH